MPNRFLKESIKRSPQIDALSWFEEVVFYRLLVTVDDFGRYYGDPQLLKNDLFPRKNSITTKSIEDAIRRLEERELLTSYVVDGAAYVFLNTWLKHNKPRAKASKFPSPEDAEEGSANICKHLQTSANKCLQMLPYSYSNSYSYSYSRESAGAQAPTHAPALTREGVKPFGKFKNVMLTAEEHDKLLAELPDAGGRIDQFSAKLKAKGYTYNDHYAALLLWYDEDQKAAASGGSFDVDDFFKAALERTYGKEKDT